MTFTVLVVMTVIIIRGIKSHIWKQSITLMVTLKVKFYSIYKVLQMGPQIDKHTTCSICSH